MSAENVEAFEQQAAELVAAAKGLLREFEDRIGEALHAQRLAVSEARAEGVQVTHQLQELSRFSKALVGQQRETLARIEREWQLRIDANAQRAGEDQAKAFGQSIAAGLAEQLENLTLQVEAATRRFAWATTLKWGLSIGIGIALAVVVGVWTLLPTVDGLSPLQVRDAITRLSPCQVQKESHVCIRVNEKPQVTKGLEGQALVVVQGM
jgi:hypothetical protein